MSAAEATVLLREILAELKTLNAKLSAPNTSQPSAPNTLQGGAVAPDSDLDGQYGDPVARFDPKDWTGPSCKGLSFSSCPSDYLVMLANTLDYFAEKDANSLELYNGKPVRDGAKYKRADAARARGWALRNRGNSTARVIEDDEVLF